MATSKGGKITYYCPLCCSPDIAERKTKDKQVLWSWGTGMCYNCNSLWNWKTRLRTRTGDQAPHKAPHKLSLAKRIKNFWSRLNAH